MPKFHAACNCRVCKERIGRNLTTGIPPNHQWVLEMRKQPCHYCGGKGGTIDHVIPTSKGGKTISKNCVPCCAPCNQAKGDK